MGTHRGYADCRRTLCPTCRMIKRWA